MTFSDVCPLCGGQTTFGYGLMGGGMGPYVFCTEGDCDYFEKSQDTDDTDEHDTEPAPASHG
jgi:hypothetical protein